VLEPAPRLSESLLKTLDTSVVEALEKALRGIDIGVAEIERLLRTKPTVPVITRIKNEAVHIDMRTVREFEVGITAKSVLEALL